jgi:4-amino-4-deoxy-L-arabinose transferase-like glycosyltransferase
MKKKQLLLLSIPFLFFIFLTGLNFNPIWDEVSYYPTMILFAKYFPEIDIYNYFIDTTEYQENFVPVVATPPLPLIIGGVFIKIFGAEIWKLRLFYGFIGFFSVYIFFKICEKLEIKEKLLLTLLFSTYPYFLLLSFIIQSDIFGVYFSLLSLYFFIDFKKKSYIISSIFTILAIYSRQFYLFIPIGYSLFYLIKNKKIIGNKFKNLYDLVIINFPFIFIFPLFLYWGGITSHAYKTVGEYATHNITFSFTKIIFFFVIVGVHFIPIVFNKFSKKNLIYSLMFIPFFIIFKLPYDCFGIICRATRIISFNMVIFYSVLIIFYLIGIYITINTIFSKNKLKNILLPLITFAILISAISHNVWQRYYLIMIPYLYLLFYNNFKNKKILNIWLIFQSLISIGYILFKTMMV